MFGGRRARRQDDRTVDRHGGGTDRVRCCRAGGRRGHSVEVAAGAPTGFGSELPPGEFRSLACEVAMAEPAEMMTAAAATVPTTRIQ